jgi:hypothetical protein
MVITRGFGPCNLGSTPSRSCTRLAQSVERQPFKLVVEGSSPSSGVRMGWRVVKSDSLKSCSFGFAGSNPASCKMSHRIGYYGNLCANPSVTQSLMVQRLGFPPFTRVARVRLPIREGRHGTWNGFIPLGSIPRTTLARIGKRSNPAASRAAPPRFVGSSPTSCTFSNSLVVECLFSTQTTRVRFPIGEFAFLAQLVERCSCKAEVGSSILPEGCPISSMDRASDF